MCKNFNISAIEFVSQVVHHSKIGHERGNQFHKRCLKWAMKGLRSLIQDSFGEPVQLNLQIVYSQEEFKVITTQ
jgi:hypothetical protein